MGGSGGGRQDCLQDWWEPGTQRDALGAEGKPLAVGAGLLEAVLVMWGFFQALPVGGKHKGHRSGPS